MKELYISPELEILCFAPIEGIAADWSGYAINGNSRSVDDGLSTGESRPGDYDETVDPGENLGN